MRITNNEPTILTVYKSKHRTVRGNLKRDFMYEANISWQTFYRKLKGSDFNEIEKNWWAIKLEMPKEVLFPPKWMNQPELSEKVKNQLIG
jgi:transposase